MSQISNEMDAPGVDHVPWQSAMGTLAAARRYGLGAAVLTLGIVVVLGWHTGNTRLIQVHPSFVPMQYNTALGFLASGLGLLLLQAGQFRVAAAAGLIAAGIGGVTGLQYLLGADFGIDEAIMTHSVTVKTSHPGRMAPNTAICFTLAGLCILATAYLQSWPYRRFVARCLSVSVLVLAAVAFAGYALGLETAYGWAKLTRMALHTSLGFIGLSIGLILCRQQDASGDPSIFWWSGATYLILALITLALTQHIARQERIAKQRIADDGAHIAVVEIENQLGELQRAVRRMADRWAVNGEPSREEWQVDADSYVRDLRVLSSLAWVDRDNQRRRQSDARHSEVFPNAGSLLRTNSVTDRSGRFFLIAGAEGPTLVLAVPVWSAGGVNDGVLLGVIETRGLLEKTLDQITQGDYAFQILADATPISTLGVPEPNAPGARSAIQLAGVSLTVVARPYLAAFRGLRSQSAIVLFIGLAIALTASVAAHLAVLDRRQSGLLSKTNGELLRSNQQLDEFAYIASHDLKEPLRAISNHCQFLTEDFGDTLDEDGVRRLDRMMALCGRLERLISDLLHFSRLGRQGMAMRPTDLNAIVDDIRDTLDEAGADITVDTSLPVLTCDTERVTELFRNLITNAIKYNDSDPKRITIGQTPGNPTEFYVQDNGIGIEKDFHDSIFRIFKRLHGEKKYGGGTGSGLTFVKKIVEEHGGRIRVESSPGTGTTFHFTLEGTPHDPTG